MKTLTLTIASILSVASFCHAQTLTIEECKSLALKNYPLIAQYGVIEKISEFNISNANRLWLPQGSISAQASWQNDVASLPDLLTEMLTQNGLEYPGIDKTQYRIGVDVTQQIWDGGKVAANKRTVESATAVEKAALDTKLYDIEGQVEDLYFSLLLINERILRTDKTIELIDSTLMQVKSMFVNGVAMKSDCDQIEATMIAMQQQKSTLGISYATAKRILEIFIGEPVGNRSFVLPSEGIENSQSATSAQSRLFNARLSNLTASEQGIRTSTMPTIGAFASGYYGYPGYNMFKNMQSRDMTFNFIAGIKVSWNFGALYNRKNSLNIISLRRKEIEIEKDVFDFNNNIAMSESLSQINALRDILKQDEKIVELRRSVLYAANSQLRNGVIDTTSLLAKLTDEELAENELTQHRIELVKAIYKLNHIRNK